jgi:hypothetical protein
MLQSVAVVAAVTTAAVAAAAAALPLVQGYRLHQELFMTLQLHKVVLQQMMETIHGSAILVQRASL